MGTDVLAFIMGVFFRTLIVFVIGDMIMKPIMKKAADEYPTHLQPFVHYYFQHEGKPKECELCRESVTSA